MTFSLAWFLRYETKSMSDKIKINWTPTKLKIFVLKGHYQESQKLTHRMRKMFANPISEKGLVSSLENS